MFALQLIFLLTISDQNLSLSLSLSLQVKMVVGSLLSSVSFQCGRLTSRSGWWRVTETINQC